MGELARLRDARDLRISRGHVAAAAVAALLLTGTAFGFGWLRGRSAAPPAPSAVGVGLTAEVPDDAMLELLARVEASAAPRDGVQALTFPDALKGGEGAAPTVPHGPEQPGEAVVVPASEAPAPVADAPPAGRYTLTVHRGPDAQAAERLKARLVEAGLPAWVGAELVNGAPAFRVAVGGYADEAAARSKLAEVAPSLGAGLSPTVEPIAP